MKRLAFIVLLVGGMFSAAIGQTQASGSHTSHVTKHAKKHAKLKSAAAAPATANSISGIELDCMASGASGQVFFSNPNAGYSGTIDLAIQYLVPGTANTYETIATTTATSASDYTFRVNYNGFPGATEYRAIVTGASPAISGVGVTSSIKPCTGSMWYGNADQHADRYGDRHSDDYPDFYSDEYVNGHVDFDGHVNLDGDRYAHRDADSHGDEYGY